MPGRKSHTKKSLPARRPPLSLSELLKGTTTAIQHNDTKLAKSYIKQKLLNGNIAACEEALMAAAKENNIELIDELINKTVLRDFKDYYTPRVLVAAAENGHVKLFSSLLTADIIENHVDILLKALEKSVRNSHNAVANILLKIKNVNSRMGRLDNPHHHPLYEAAKTGNLYMLNKLLKHNTVKNDIDYFVKQALSHAVQSGHLNIVNRLLRFKIYAVETLVCAAGSDHIDVFNRLLEIEEFQTLITHDKNHVLRIAIRSGNFKIVDRILKIDSVKESIADYAINLLGMAVEGNHLMIAQRLLKLPVVQKALATNESESKRSELLETVVEHNFIDMARTLLTNRHFKTLISANDNILFLTAVGKGFVLMTKELLRHSIVSQRAAANDNLALESAIGNYYDEMTETLLKLPVVANALTFSQIIKIATTFKFINLSMLNPSKIIAKSCLSKKALHSESLLYKLYSVDAQILFIKYLNYYGYNPVDSTLQGSELIMAIKHSIENSFTQTFLSPRSHAGEILQQIANVKALARSTNYANFAGNAESAMDDDLLEQAHEHFKHKIKPAFEKKFDCIENIEKKLCELLLDRKLSNKDLPEQTVQFIQKNKSELINRDPEIIAQSRHYFNSLNDTVDIAWRALDAGAPSIGWEKLFVAPTSLKEGETVFSGRHASIHDLDLLNATHIARERLCYAYLVATDEALTPKQQEETINRLIFYIAEIGRAHNENDPNGLDNHSCFPGTMTRLDLIFQAHPNFTIPHDLFKIVPELASQLIVKAFRTELPCLNSEQDRQDLLDAMTLYSEKTATKIINAPNSVFDIDGEKADLNRMLGMRMAFFDKYFSKTLDVFDTELGETGERAIQEINARLRKDYKLMLDKDTKVIAIAALLNMGWATPHTCHSLTATFLNSRSKQPINPIFVKNKPQTFTPRFQSLIQTRASSHRFADNDENRHDNKKATRRKRG